MFDPQKDLPPRHAVTLEFIGDDHAGFVFQTRQQPLEEPFGGRRIPSRLNENVEHDAILVYRAPKVVLCSLDANEHLVHIPLISRPRPAVAHAVGEALTAHSGDLERSFRSIMNTDSGDHEHSARASLSGAGDRDAVMLVRYH
jgi:hypothetical protein